jgi:hypothetical protein
VRIEVPIGTPLLVGAGVGDDDDAGGLDALLLGGLELVRVGLVDGDFDGDFDGDLLGPDDGDLLGVDDVGLLLLGGATGAPVGRNSTSTY